MTPIINGWATRHSITPLALKELMSIFGLYGEHSFPIGVEGNSEAAVQSIVRLEGARKGIHLFRNNVGACVDDKGRLIRYGLANDSKKVNSIFKSGDLIGFRPVLIKDDHVGTVIGQFVSRECKQKGWQYKATEREVAQLNWAQLVVSNGGDAAFCTGEGTL